MSPMTSPGNNYLNFFPPVLRAFLGTRSGPIYGEIAPSLFQIPTENIEKCDPLVDFVTAWPCAVLFSGSPIGIGTAKVSNFNIYRAALNESQPSPHFKLEGGT